MSIQVVVDDRESGNVEKFLAQADGVTVIRQRLPVGDFFVDQQMLVERKTVTDLAASIIDGRLFRQAINLASSDIQSMLILEDPPGDQARMQLSRESLQGGMISLAVILGIPVLHSRSSQETAWLILAAARQKRHVEGGRAKRCGSRPKGHRKRQLFILQGLPNVGPDRAEQLLDYFGSVQAVMQAEYEELIQVKSIGKSIARNIRSVLAGETIPERELASGEPNQH